MKSEIGVYSSSSAINSTHAALTPVTFSTMMADYRAVVRPGDRVRTIKYSYDGSAAALVASISSHFCVDFDLSSNRCSSAIIVHDGYVYVIEIREGFHVTEVFVGESY